MEPEYYIQSESLTYFALKNKSGYWCKIGNKYQFSFDMSKIEFFNSLHDAIEVQMQLVDETEIRKVKVIDIGMC